MDSMGLTSLSAMPYVVVLVTGIWIGSMLIPWLPNLQEARSVANASNKVTANAPQITVQAIAKTSHSASPKARARRSERSNQTHRKALTLYGYGGRFHVSPYCNRGGEDRGLETLSISEPCSHCIDSEAILVPWEMYITSQGEKYHTRNCRYITKARFARALSTCRCVLEHHTRLRQMEDHDDKGH